MKYLIALMLFLSVGCTHVAYTAPDGRTISYTSFKEFQSLEVEIHKDDEEILGHVRVEGVTADLAGEVADAAVKTMGIGAGAGVIKDVAKGLVQKKIQERKMRND